MTRWDDKWLLRAWGFGLAMTAFFAVYAFMSVASACMPMRPAPPTKEEEAHSALRDGRVLAALRLFEAAGQNEWVARLRYQLGTEALAKKSLIAAELDLRAAVRANPKHVGAFAELVETMRKLGRHDAGLRLVTAAKSNMQKEPLVRGAKAKIHYDLGDLPAARALLAPLAAQNVLPTALRPLWNKLGVRLVGPGHFGM